MIFDVNKKELRADLDVLHERMDKTERLCVKGMIYRGSLEFVGNILNQVRIKFIEDNIPK